MPVDPNKYSIYAARDVDKSNVNWGKVATDLTTTLTTVATDKITKRAALDTATQEAIENLSKVADVKNSDAQSLLLNGAEMSKENLLLQSDMMKKGLITTKDFMLFLQQQKAGYANLSSAIKNWDKYFQESELRLTPDSAGKQGAAQEIWSGKSMASFGNLKDKILWTNPNTGQMQLVQMDKDVNGNYTVMPDPVTNPEKFMNPNSMNSRMNIRIDKKDLNTEVQKIVKPLGKTIQETLYSTGTSIRTEGFRFADISSGVADDKKTTAIDESKLSYEQWLESQINKLAGGSNDQVQILTDNGYTIAASKDEFYRKCKDMGGKCTDEYWLKADTTGGELVWNHIVPQADLEAQKDTLLAEHNAIPTDTSEKNILKQQIDEIDRYLNDNKIPGTVNVLVNGLSDSQIEKAKQIARSTIDTHIDNIEKTTYKQEDKTSEGYRIQKQQGQEMLTNLKAVYSATDQQNLDNALKSIMSLTGLSFDEIDQEIVNGEIVSIKVPYVNEGGTKTFIDLDLQSKKTVEGKDVYTPIPFNEFAKQAYEYLNLGTEKKFVPFSDLDIDLEEEVIFNPYTTPTYEKKNKKFFMPDIKDAEEGKFYKNPTTKKGYIVKDGKYVEVTGKGVDRQFAPTTITPFEGRGGITLSTNVGTAEKPNITGEKIQKIAKNIQTLSPFTRNVYYAKQLRDESLTMIKDIGVYLGVPQSVYQGFEASVDGSDMTFKLPAITLPNNTVIPAKTIELLYKNATEAKVDEVMMDIINHMYPEYAAGEITSRGKKDNDPLDIN